MKRILMSLASLCVCLLLLVSCSEDREHVTLPIFEMGVSSDDVRVGDNVIVSLNNVNHPNNLRYNSYVWSCSPSVDGLTSSTPNKNNSFVPTVRGKHVLTVRIDITNYADGNPSDTGKTIQRGETVNTYTSVSTLKTIMTVSRTIIVR